MSGSNTFRVENIHDAIPAINEIIRTESALRSHINIGLAGGVTPVAIYQDWLVNGLPSLTFTNIFLTDERFAPLESPDSNYKNCWQAWSRVSNNHRLFPIDTNGEINECAQRYELEILSVIGTTTPGLDLALLGVGVDGHTASIFPDAIVNKCQHGIVGFTIHPITAQPRITLTSQFLLSARRIIVICFGESKRLALQQALRPDCKWLISRVLRSPNTCLFSDLI